MGFFSKQNRPASASSEDRQPNLATDTSNGALDTLTSLIRVSGEESFPLDKDSDPELFLSICSDLARHVENGAAVPDLDIDLNDRGKREWETVQRFMVDRRRQEKIFVTERLGNYREIVNDLVSGFREIGHKDENAADNIRECLSSMQDAIGDDELPKIKTAMAETIATVHEIFAEQKNHYEAELKKLNDRMSSLREDLIATRAEMKQDSLTQTFNRGAFDMAITQSVNTHYFSGEPVSLLMIDLDEFKQVNDSYGHTVGDAVLRAVGECLARTFIRKNDLIARYGGDEFAVILQDTVETFVNRADKALFKAKAKGRNQSVFH